MVFNPKSTESCEYYGVPYKEEHLIGRSSAGSHDYYPNQSRDYALSNTVQCECKVCPVNKNGYCEMPSAIRISAAGVCKIGESFVKQEPLPPHQAPDWDKHRTRDSFTPIWFWEKWRCNCPQLTDKELEKYEHIEVGSELSEAWHSEVTQVNKSKRKR